MKTKNIFRMLLVAATLLLGANQVKADETFTLWESSNGAEENMSQWTTKSLDNAKLQRIVSGDVIKFYGSTVSDSHSRTLAVFTSNNNLIIGIAYAWDAEPFQNGVASYTVTDYQETQLHDTNNPPCLTVAGCAVSKVEVVHSGKSVLALEFTSSEASVKMGETLASPALNSDVAVTYSSDDATVATVNASTGVVTPVKTGSTNIIATFAGNDTYGEATASYKVTVTKGDPNLSFAESSMSVKIGETKASPTLNNPHNVAVRYFTYNEYPVEVNASTGAVTGLHEAVGVEIRATFDGNDNWASSTATYKLDIVSSDKQDPNISYSQTVYYITNGDSFTAPTLSNPNSVSVSYESSNTSVATVSSEGAVTVVGPGEATIKATSTESDTYLSKTAEYTLIVKHAFSASTEGTSLWTGSVYFGNWQQNGKGQSATIASTAFANVNVGDKLRFYGTFETLHDNFWQLQVNNNSWQQIAFVQASDSFADGYVDIEVTDDILTGLGGGNVYIQGYNLTLAAVTLIAGSTPEPVQTEFNITVSTSITGGTVSVKDGKTTATVGDTVELTATADANYSFSAWDVKTASGASVTVTDNKFTMPASDVTVSATFTRNASSTSVTVGGTGWATYCSSLPIDYSLLSGAKAYRATSTTTSGGETKVVLTQITGKASAYTPVLIYKQGGGSVSLTEALSGASSVGTNLLRQGTGSIKGSNYYVLVARSGSAVFAQLSSNSANVASDQAYLDLSSVAGARTRHISLSIAGEDDGTTGISDIDAEPGSQTVYDLQGRRVERPSKGLYIINGKKVVLK